MSSSGSFGVFEAANANVAAIDINPGMPVDEDVSGCPKTGFISAFRRSGSSPEALSDSFSNSIEDDFETVDGATPDVM